MCRYRPYIHRPGPRSNHNVLKASFRLRSLCDLGQSPSRMSRLAKTCACGAPAIVLALLVLLTGM